MIYINGQMVDAGPLIQSLNMNATENEIIKWMAEKSSGIYFDSVDLVRFETSLRAATIASAYQLNNSKAAFATFYYSKCNDRFWYLTNEGGFRLRPQVPASVAIRDIFQNSHLYAFECATAMMIVLYRAVLAVLPDSTFDRLYYDLYLWDWNQNDDLPIRVYRESGRGIPGDVRYFRNPQVDPRTPQWQGENVIQLLNGQYYGHGVGVTDAQGIINALNAHRIPGAYESAYLMNRASRPIYKYLARWRGALETTES